MEAPGAQPAADRRSDWLLPLEGAADAGLIATIRELACSGPADRNARRYSMETGDESPATHRQP